MTGRHHIPDHGIVLARRRATVLVLLLTGQMFSNRVPTRHDGTQRAALRGVS